MQNIGRSYTFRFKKQVVEEADTSSLAAVADKYGIDYRMLRRWAKDVTADERPEAGRSSGGERKPIIPGLEDAIFDWVIDRRIQCLPVSRGNIQEFALRMASQDPVASEHFKASTTWLRRFMDRYELSLRRSTTLFRLEDQEIVNRAVSFKNFVDSIDFARYNPRHVIAMDETAVYYGKCTRQH